MNKVLLELKISILKKAREFTLDEVHSYLKVLGFQTDNDYARWTKDEYLSWSIESISDEDLLKLLSNSFNKDANTEIRVWKDGHYRLFISHKTSHKIRVSELKEYLVDFGIDAFVAHEDIQVSVQWRDALVQALKTMNCLLAYITDDFSDKDWCSQEVGFACVSGARIIPLKIETKDPLGFLGFYQAANVSSLDATGVGDEIISKLIDIDRDVYLESMLFALNSEANFTKTKNILEFLINRKVTLRAPQLQKIEEICLLNAQVGGYSRSTKYLEQIKNYSNLK